MPLAVPIRRPCKDWPIFIRFAILLTCKDTKISEDFSLSRSTLDINLLATPAGPQADEFTQVGRLPGTVRLRLTALDK